MTITGEILLWRAVIDRAARDAFGCTDSNLYRHQALRWFFQKSPKSFCFVCDLAELDPDAVRDHFFKALMTKNMGASSKGVPRRILGVGEETRDEYEARIRNT